VDDEISHRRKAAQDERHSTRNEARCEQHTADGFNKPGGNPEDIGHLPEHGKHLFDIFHVRKINQLRKSVLKEKESNHDAQKRLRRGCPSMQHYLGRHLSSAFKPRRPSLETVRRRSQRQKCGQDCKKADQSRYCIFAIRQPLHLPAASKCGLRRFCRA
jgi:hypothetical protein